MTGAMPTLGERPDAVRLAEPGPLVPFGPYLPPIVGLAVEVDSAIPRGVVLLLDHQRRVVGIIRTDD